LLISDFLRNHADIIPKCPAHSLPKGDAVLIFMENDHSALLDACLSKLLKTPIDKPTSNSLVSELGMHRQVPEEPASPVMAAKNGPDECFL
jgi:hypothetical protein